jgi:tetratricopeptide (TPR) repeat protein
VAHIFISYSRKDMQWLDRLKVHLKPLQDSGQLDYWDDSRIRAGSNWRNEINQAITRADVAVLLVSADFLASDFVMSEELPAILGAQRRRGLQVLCALLKPCRVSSTPLRDVQFAHSSDRPVASMSESEQETLWMQLAGQIEEHCLDLDGDDRDDRELSWNVPLERNPYFCGRTATLKTVREQLENSARAALCGLGGVGKTQLAVEYAHRFRDTYSRVFWVNADTELSSKSSYADIARLLDLPEWQDRDQDEAVKAAKAWLEQSSGWLLIIDNADTPEQVRPLCPRGRSGHVLITSRSPATQSLGVQTPIRLTKLTPDEALAFLRMRTERTLNEASEELSAAELALELGYLPLALEQAGAYVTANQSRFRDYLKGYRKRRLRVLADPVVGEYSESVATTWAVNFDEVERIPAAADLLRLSAFLHPDAIPLELLARSWPWLGPSLSLALEDVAEDPLLIDEVLEPLHRYSLIRRDIGGRTYSIHRIMQAVLVDRMSLEEQREWAGRAVRSISEAFPEPEFANWYGCGRLLHHAQSCAALIERFAFDSREAAYLLLDAGEYLRRRAQYAESAALQTQLLQMREQLLGPDHTAVAETLMRLAKVYRAQGQYERALELVDRALVIVEKEYGPNDPKVGAALNTKAALLRNLGRLDDAEKAARRSLAIREKPGSEGEGLAHTLTTLSIVLRERGDLEEAETLARRALHVEEESLGPTHPNLSPSLTTLGTLCRLRAHFDEAEATLQRAIDLDEAALGPDHPRVAFGLIELAEVYADQSRWSDALPLVDRALVNLDKLGQDHPKVRATKARGDEIRAAIDAG